MKEIQLLAFAQLIGAELKGDPTYTLGGLNTLLNAQPHQVAFLANPKYLAHLKTTQAGAVILQASQADEAPAGTNLLVAQNPYLCYAKAAQFFDNQPAPFQGIHATALVHPEAKIAEGVSIGPYATIDAGAVLAENVVIGAHCVVGNQVQIGARTRLFPRVTLYPRVQIGSDSTLHSGVVIGADGFGWAKDGERWIKIPQLGSVRIGDRVEIGANTTIDRGALEDTFIGSGCIIDNLCMIGHNVVIGENTAMAGQVGIAGSTEIGKNCLIGGQAGFGGHLQITDGVQFHGQSMVTKSVSEPGVYASGVPIMEQGTWAKTGVRFRQLPDLFSRVRALEKKNHSS